MTIRLCDVGSRYHPRAPLCGYFEVQPVFGEVLPIASGSRSRLAFAVVAD